MIVYNPHKSLSTSLMTSEAGSLMSHHGADGSYELAPPPPLATRAGRRAYGFADTSKINAAQGCTASYTFATGQTVKFNNLRPAIASRLELLRSRQLEDAAAAAQLQSVRAENLALLEELEVILSKEDARQANETLFPDPKTNKFVFVLIFFF